MKTMSEKPEQMPDNATDRPLVTFALFAYNQEKYIREAVEGAFAQTYERMEIILSDDYSSDSTFEIMQEMAAVYEGPHDVLLRRNDYNMGLGAHFNKVLENSHGEIILMAAGDDISFASRTEYTVDLFDKNPEATSILLSAKIINSDGDTVGERILDMSTQKERSQTIQDLLSWRHITFGATRAIRRDVYFKFGPLQSNCPTEDTPLLLRSLVCGKNILSAEKGVSYRKHNFNLSGQASLAKMNIDAIYAQYEIDIQKAATLRLLSKNTVRTLLTWIRLDRNRRLIGKIRNDGGTLGLKQFYFLTEQQSFRLINVIKITLTRLFWKVIDRRSQ